MSISCLPFSGILEFCIECDKVTAFLDTFKCIYCGCDSPFGEFYNPNISDEEIENYIETQNISFGLISEIKDENLLFFLSNK